MKLVQLQKHTELISYSLTVTKRNLKEIIMAMDIRYPKWKCTICFDNGVTMEPIIEAPDANTARAIYEGMYPNARISGAPMCISFNGIYGPNGG
jgi:hypothetical protein